MTREEFELRRLKEDRALYRWLVPIYVMILLAFVAMSIAAFFMGKAPISLGGALIILSLALRVPAILQHKTDTVDAVAEYEAYLANPERDESMLSESTLTASSRWSSLAALCFCLPSFGTSRPCLPSAPRFWLWASSWRG